MDNRKKASYKWEEFLASLSPEKRISLSKIRDFAQFKTWHEENHIERNAEHLWDAKNEFDLEANSTQNEDLPEKKEGDKKREEVHRKTHYHMAEELKKEAREDARSLERPQQEQFISQTRQTRTIGKSAVNRFNGIPVSVRKQIGRVSSFVRGATATLKRGRLLTILATTWPIWLIPLIIVLIIILIVVMASFLFPNDPGLIARGAELETSQYPGISYSVSAVPEEPQRAEIDDEITYKINFIYTNGQATAPLESIIIVSTYTPTEDVEVISASGVNTQELGKVSWPLSQNTPIEQGSQGSIFTFDLKLKTTDNLVLTNTLSLEGISPSTSTTTGALPIKPSAITYVGEEQEEDYEGNPLPPPPDEEIPSGCPDPRATLAAYNITYTGSVTAARQALLCNIVVKFYSYPGLRQKMEGPPLSFAFVNVEERWWGYAPNRRTIRLNKFDRRGDPLEWRFIVTHELFHNLSQRNRALYKRYPHPLSDSGCYRPVSSGQVIKTYKLEPNRAKSESFAEAGTLVIFGRSPFRGTNFTNFGLNCGSNYNWFNANVFR